MLLSIDLQVFIYSISPRLQRDYFENSPLSLASTFLAVVGPVGLEKYAGHHLGHLCCSREHAGPPWRRVHPGDLEEVIRVGKKHNY